jgi:hypothetical protein
MANEMTADQVRYTIHAVLNTISETLLDSTLSEDVIAPVTGALALLYVIRDGVKIESQTYPLHRADSHRQAGGYRSCQTDRCQIDGAHFPAWKARRPIGVWTKIASRPAQSLEDYPERHGGRRAAPRPIRG